MKIEKILKKTTPDVRYLYDMGNVLYDKKLIKKAKNIPLYFMYRGIKKRGKLRYDITVIPPKLLGKEFVKTKGHRHLKAREKYTVLRGKAIFLLQKYNEREDKLEKVIAFKAKKGESIIIPPLYDHITINPCKRFTLVLSNWIPENAKSDYSILQKKKGAAYFYTLDGWIKNRNYKDIPDLEIKKPLSRGGGIGRRARFRT